MALAAPALGKRRAAAMMHYSHEVTACIDLLITAFMYVCMHCPYSVWQIQSMADTGPVHMYYVCRGEYFSCQLSGSCRHDIHGMVTGLRVSAKKYLPCMTTVGWVLWLFHLN